MVITEVDATPLSIPFVEPFHWRSGVQRGGNVVVFSVRTDDGIVGYGESIAENPAAIEAYGKQLAEAFIGRSPGDIEAIRKDLWSEGRWRFTPRITNQILSGIETACWDAWGKALGVPASTFFGGRVRSELDFMGFPQGSSVDAVAEQAAALAERGYRVIYVKVGRAEREDRTLVAAIRDAIGSDPLLRIDANEAWDVPTAIDRIRSLEAYGLDWVEQPVSGDNIPGLAQVRRSVSTKIAADQAVYTAGELRAVLDQQAADVIVLGSHEAGGLWQLRKLAFLAETYGVPINRHGCVESAISTYASLQVFASLPNVTLGNQLMHQLLAESITLDSDTQPEPGALAIPTTPGIGVEIDADGLAHAHECFKRDGPFLLESHSKIRQP
jgi:L-alanine-DL-glutamate epimerase-like enolase superfamily enzyme